MNKKLKWREKLTNLFNQQSKKITYAQSETVTSYLNNLFKGKINEWWEMVSDVDKSYLSGLSYGSGTEFKSCIDHYSDQVKKVYEDHYNGGVLDITHINGHNEVVITLVHEDKVCPLILRPELVGNNTNRYTWKVRMFEGYEFVDVNK